MASNSRFPFLNIVLLLGAIGVLGAAYILIKNNKPIRILPIYGSKEYNATTHDTDYHTVLNFKLTSEQGHIVTLDSFRHSIFVANFFYASCPGICKKMNNELESVTKDFATNPHVKFISYTVDPRRDSVPVLAEYAHNHDALPYRWYFLTGKKDEIYNLAIRSYFASVDTADGVNFVHTDNMALVDTAGHLRGFYKGTDTTEMHQLVKDITLLLREEGLENKN